MSETGQDVSPVGVVWRLLIDRWHTTLKAKALSKETVRGYLFTANKWVDWLAEQGYELEPVEIRDVHIEEFIAEIVVATSAANAAYNYRNLRVFWAWLVRREKLAGGNPMEATEPPTVPTRLTPVFTERDESRLLKTCGGRGFLAARDLALILLFRDTGARVSEVGGMVTADVKPAARLARLVGKGNRERQVGFSADTGLAVARYLKARQALVERTGVDPEGLWLGRRGRRLSVDGIKLVLRRRGEQAGVTKVHAHRFRHNFAHTWKVRHGSDEGLMAIGGWSSEKMAHHYGSSARAQRALAEQRELILAEGGRS